MADTWQSNKPKIEYQIDQLIEDVEAHDKALHALGEKISPVLFVMSEVSQTGPLAGKLAKYQLEINILKEDAEAFKREIRDEISSMRADYTILKGVAAQAVEDKAAEKLKGERKLQIDLENTKGKWIVIGLVVTNLFTLIALLLKQ